MDDMDHMDHMGHSTIGETFGTGDKILSSRAHWVHYKVLLITLRVRFLQLNLLPVRVQSTRIHALLDECWVKPRREASALRLLPVAAPRTFFRPHANPGGGVTKADPV